MNTVVLKLKNISKKFHTGQSELTILENVNFELKIGESVALLSPSGTGKSTFLQIAATLEQPSSGEIWIDSQNVSELSDNEKSKLRLSTLGFVYQFHNLLPDFTALENVMIPMLIANTSKTEARLQAEKLLNKVSLNNRFNHLPSELSGGEQQRVAIARALSNNPKIILADEPTGNLDPKTALQIFNLFIQLVHTSNISLIMATHNIELANLLSKRYCIQNCQLISI